MILDKWEIGLEAEGGMANSSRCHYPIHLSKICLRLKFSTLL